MQIPKNFPKKSHHPPTIPQVLAPSIGGTSSSSNVQMREPNNYFASTNTPASLKSLGNRIKNFGNGEVVTTLNFKSAFLGVEVMLPFLKEDIVQFLIMQEIGSSIVIVYMW